MWQGPAKLWTGRKGSRDRGVLWIQDVRIVMQSVTWQVLRGLMQEKEGEGPDSPSMCLGKLEGGGRTFWLAVKGGVAPGVVAYFSRESNNQKQSMNTQVHAITHSYMYNKARVPLCRWALSRQLESPNIAILPPVFLGV